MSDILYHVKFQMDERVKYKNSNHKNTRRSHKKKKKTVNEVMDWGKPFEI